MINVTKDNRKLNFINYKHSLTYLVVFVLLVLLFLGIYYEDNRFLILMVVISLPFIIWDTWLGVVFLFVTAIVYYVTLFPGISLYRTFALITFFSFLFGTFIKRKIYLNYQLSLWAMLITIISLLSILVSVYPEDSIVEFLSLFVNILVLLSIMSMPYKLDYFKLELIAFAASSLMLFLGITIYAKGLYIDIRRLSLTEEVNPNSFAMGIAQILPFLLSSYFLLQNKSLIKKLIIVLGILVGMVTLIFTGSRSSILGMVVGINLVLYLCNKDNKLKKWFAIISFDSLLVLLILGTQFYNPYLFQRFTIKDLFESHFARRGDIQKYIFNEVIPKHIWLGTGIGGGSVVQALAFSGVPQIYQKPAHNILIDILAQLGIIGLVIFSIFYAISLWKGWGNLSKSPFLIPFYAIFITSLIIGIGETVYLNKMFWISIAMIWKQSLRYKKYSTVQQLEQTVEY